MNNDKKQILWLNSIKGIACWIVFLGHFQGDYGYIPFLRIVLSKTPFGFFTNGTVALNVFYIISAFLLSKSLFENSDKLVEKAGKSIILRYFRLAIPVLLMNLVVYISQLTRFGSDRIYGMFTEKYNLFEVFSNAFVGSVFLGDEKFNSMMWMMDVLFLGTLFVSMIIIIVYKMKLRSQLIILSILTLVFMCFDIPYAPMVFGIILYILFSNNVFTKINAIVGNAFGCMAIVIAVIWAGYAILFSNMILGTKLPPIPFGAFWIHDWAAAMLLMIGIFMSSGVRKVLDTKWLSKTGSICLPMFIFSRVWEATFGELAYRVFTAIRGNEPDGVKASFVVTIVVSIAFSVIYIKFIEPQLNKMINKLLTKL